MRIFLKASDVNRVIDLTSKEGAGIIIQIIDPVNVYFSNEENDLRTVDNAGVPKAGWLMVSAIPPPLQIIPFYRDKLFARPSADGYIEVQAFACYAGS